MKDKVTDAEIDKAIAEAEDMSKPSLVDRLWGPIGDRLDTPPPNRDYIIKDLLVSGKVGILAGHGGRGKTWALTQLAISIATGKGWFGRFYIPKQGRVILALGEEDQEEMHRRIYEAKDALKLSPEQYKDIKKNLFDMPLAGHDVSFLDGEGQPTEFYNNLHARITAEEDLRLVILDPLSRFAGHDTETDNKSATTFITHLEKLTKANSKLSVICAHHEKKPGSSSKDDQFSVRGSSGLVDGARWVARLGPVYKQGGDLDYRKTRFSVVKSNYSGHMEPLTLEKREGCSGVLFPEEMAFGGSSSPGRKAGGYSSDLVDDADL